MSGQIPLWGYIVGAVLVNAGLVVGMWVGWGRGWAHCEEEQRWKREQAAARAVHPVYRVRPPEVAHEEFDAHATRALAIANERGVSPYGCVGPSSPEQAGQHLKDPIGPPDPRTDSQWTADKAAEMNAFLDSLLNDHPATEDL